MKHILLFSAACFLLLAPTFAKGHGHGGHGGGGRSSSHSGGVHAGGSHIGGGNNSGGVRTSGTHHTSQSKTKAAITRSTSPQVIAQQHHQGLMTKNTGTMPGPRGVETGGYTGPVYGQGYYYYGGYYPYYSSPYFYDPYFSMWTIGCGFMYSPSYYPSGASNNAGYANSDQMMKEPMDGFVVFYKDTISGSVTLGKREISLETTDSGKAYDYEFHIKNMGLTYVTVYNEDNKQLTLQKLQGDTKTLWRSVHTGKLNIYDKRRGFIYKPEDIDVKTLTVSYNGEVSSLKSSSTTETKKWLTEYVNKAYDKSFDPKNFSWNELLIYIDKLD